MTPLQTVQAYFAAFNEGKIQETLDLLDDNVIWNIMGDPNVTTVGFLQGKDRVLRWMKSFPLNFAPLDFEIEDYFTTGSEVIVTGRFRHKIISTGRVAGSDMMIRFVVNDGLICKYQIFEDSAVLSQAFNKTHQWGATKQRINGNIYAYEDSQIGSGEPLLFTHGLFLNKGCFSDQVKALSENHRCINIDLLGHGESGTPDEKWMLEDVADDLALLIKENHLAPINYVGLSQGGMIGIRLAAKYPDLVKKLILIGTSARADLPEHKQNWLTLKQNILEDSSAKLHNKFITVQQKIFPQKWITENPNKASEERQMMLSNDRRGMALSIDAALLNRLDVRELLPQIKAETLVLCGEEDPAIPVEQAKEIAENIPNGELIILPGIGHHAPMEAPEVITKNIRDFLTHN